MPLIEGYLCEKRGLPMSLKSVCFGLAVLVSASSVSMAQSLPNYGANPPRNVDSFGQPPSGAKPPGVSRYGHRAYAYVPNQHRRHSRYWHHRHCIDESGARAERVGYRAPLRSMGRFRSERSNRRRRHPASSLV